MKKIAAALIGIVALVVAAGLLLSDFTGKQPSKDDPGDPPAAAIESGQKAPPAAGVSDESRVANLLREGTPMARMELVSLYAAWSKNPARTNDRRTIVHEIVKREEPAAAIHLLSMAVAGDPAPLEADELIAEVGRAMTPLWKDEKMFAEGRDMLRLAENDKVRALLAASLSERAAMPPGGLAEIVAKERQDLASDLIQINMHSSNQALKAQTLRNVEAVAGPEVAEVLADPANAHNSVMARRIEQSMRQAGEQAHAQAQANR